MGKVLDFRKATKKYLTITLADENATTIMCSTPTKAVMDALLSLESYLKEVEVEGEGEEVKPEVLDELYSICAKIMSRNKGDILITSDHLGDIFDLEDVMIFFNAYMDFIAEVTDTKN